MGLRIKLWEEVIIDMGMNIFDGTDVASAVISAVLDTHQKFGINYIASILIGSKLQKITRYKHEQISCYGRLKHFSFEQVKAFILELIEQEYIEQTKGEYPTLKIQPKANLVIASKEQVDLKEPEPNLARRLALQKGETIAKTIELFKEGKTIVEIASERNLAQGTILSHLADAYQQGEEINIDEFVSNEKQETITKAFKKLGTDFLTPVKNDLGLTYTWEDLKLVRAKLLRTPTN